MKGHTRMGWHLLSADRQLNYEDGRVVEVGKVLYCKGAPKLCHNGMHAAPKILDCMFSLATHNSTLADPRPWLCRVKVYDATKHKGRKFVGRGRRVVWMRRLTKPVLRSLVDEMGLGVSHHSARELWGKLNLAPATGRRPGHEVVLAWAKKHGCPGLGRATKKRRTK